MLPPGVRLHAAEHDCLPLALLGAAAAAAAERVLIALLTPGPPLLRRIRLQPAE